MNMTYELFLKRLAAAVPAVGRLSYGDLYDLVRAVEVLGLERPCPDHLWPLLRIAAHLGLDLTQAEQAMADPAAPQPITGHEVRLWKAGDIYAWIDRHRLG